MDPHNLNRFVEAQQRSYNNALAEVTKGRKTSHWMWYIFPQIQGLGFSETSRHYGIKNKQEATAYLQHPVLGSRLVEIANALLFLPTNDAHKIFGSPDDLKLQSSMTLFASIPSANPVFTAVLEKFFGGKKDPATISLLSNQ